MMAASSSSPSKVITEGLNCTSVWYMAPMTRTALSLVFVADQALGTYTVPQVFSFTTFVKGDANGDGVVNVTDIMAVANYILKIQMQTFVEAAADVNGDNSVNVTDIMGIANIILKVTPSSNSRATSEVDAVEPQ